MSNTPNWDKVTLSMTQLLTDPTPEQTNLWFIVLTNKDSGNSIRCQIVLSKGENPSIIGTLRYLNDQMFSADKQDGLDASVKLRELFRGSGVTFDELEEALAS